MCAVCDVHMSRVQWQCVITVSRAAGASSVVVMLVTGYAPVALAPNDAGSSLDRWLRLHAIECAERVRVRERERERERLDCQTALATTVSIVRATERTCRSFAHDSD